MPPAAASLSVRLSPYKSLMSIDVLPVPWNLHRTQPYLAFEFEFDGQIWQSPRTLIFLSYDTDTTFDPDDVGYLKVRPMWTRIHAKKLPNLLWTSTSMK